MPWLNRIDGAWVAEARRGYRDVFVVGDRLREDSLRLEKEASIGCAIASELLAD